MTSYHTVTRAKNDVFGPLVHNASVKGTFFIDSGDFECKILGLLTPFGNFYYSEFRLKTGEFEEKVKKCFLDGQKRANMAIFVAR